MGMGGYKNGIVELEVWEDFAKNRDDPDEWFSRGFNEFNKWRLRYNPPYIRVGFSSSIRQRELTTLTINPPATNPPRKHTILCPQIKNGIFAF